MKKGLVSTLLVAILLVLLPGTALAQAYAFNIPTETVNVFWNEDGSASLDYVIVFNNDSGAHPIDYVDLGLPNASFVDSSITADVNGAAVTDISRSGFQGTGPGVVAGVAIGLGSRAISAGSSGTVHARVGKVSNMLQADSQKGFASAVFSPAWFTTAHGVTNLTVIFHFPKGVGTQDATDHATQPGWADQPLGSTDDAGLVIFTWTSASAVMNQKIDFGASFPSTLSFAPVAPPPAAVPVSTPTSNTQSNFSGLIIVILFFGGIFLLAFISNSSGSKAAYEPPRISVEGYGIKRGLTAIQAAVLLKEPVDKILTMILFSVVKKGAAEVTSTDPLKLTVHILKGLEPYEISFLEAYTKDSTDWIRQGLESTLVTLFRDVDQSMDGFSRQNSVDYYQSIVKNAWAQVEAADTPEVTSQKFDQNLDWAMLDQEYAPRTQHLFENKQVTLPLWWGHFDPGIQHPTPAVFLQTPQISIPGTSGASSSLPVVPGADFAASIVRSTQDFSSTVIGDINAFTQGVIQKSATLPPPPPPPPSESSGTSDGYGGFFSSSHSTYHPSHSSGGHHCACACAGGGR